MLIINHIDSKKKIIIQRFQENANFDIHVHVLSFIRIGDMDAGNIVLKFHLDLLTLLGLKRVEIEKKNNDTKRA